MGLTHVSIKVGNPANGRRAEEVRCLVDSGAVYSLIPGRTLRRLGIKPHSTSEFVLVNGDVIRRRLATATLEYEGRRGDSMVIVGERKDEALLGVITIESLGLVLDPFRRALRPMQLPLKPPRSSERGLQRERTEEREATIVRRHRNRLARQAAAVVRISAATDGSSPRFRNTRVAPNRRGA